MAKRSSQPHKRRRIRKALTRKHGALRQTTVRLPQTLADLFHDIADDEGYSFNLTVVTFIIERLERRRR